MEPFEAKFNGVEIVARAKSLHISFSYFTATGEGKKIAEEEKLQKYMTRNFCFKSFI